MIGPLGAAFLVGLCGLAGAFAAVGLRGDDGRLRTIARRLVGRDAATGGLRGAIAGCLLGIVCGASLPGAEPVAPLRVVCIDRSHSVAPVAGWLEERARSWLARAPADDRRAVVLFAERAVVAVPPTRGPFDEATLEELGAGVDLRGRATDLAAAVERALDLCADGPGEILLLTDGRSAPPGDEDRGAVADAVARGVPVTVASPPSPPPDLRVAGASVPAAVAPGSSFDVEVLVANDGPVPARATVEARTLDRADDAPASLEVRVAAGGTVSCRLRRTADGEAGPLRLRVRVRPDDPAADADPWNDEVQLGTWVGERSTALLVAAPATREALAPALRASGVDPVPLAAPEVRAEELVGAELVVLGGLPSDRLPPGGPAALARFVDAGGGGLLALGGPDAFGAGGWGETPLADVLPVRPRPEDAPRTVALAILLDRSGSMGEPTGAGTKWEAMVRALAPVPGLRRGDPLLVLAFATGADVLLGPGPAPGPADVADRLRTARPPGGSTDLFPALRRALSWLREVEADRRALWVITDGRSDRPADAGAVVREGAAGIEDLRAAVVSVGERPDRDLLETVADALGGRYVALPDAGPALEALVRRELDPRRRDLIREGPFPVDRAGEPATLAALGEVPRVGGYVRTGAREEATTAWRIQGDPLLAWHRAGLGRAAALTTSLGPPWGEELASAVGTRLVDRMTRWVRPGPREAVSLETTDRIGGGRDLVATLEPARGLSVEEAPGLLEVAPLDGAEPAGPFVLERTGPRTWEGELPGAAGVTSRAVALRTPDGRVLARRVIGGGVPPESRVLPGAPGVERLVSAGARPSGSPIVPSPDLPRRGAPGRDDRRSLAWLLGSLAVLLYLGELARASVRPGGKRMNRPERGSDGRPGADA